MCGWGEPDMVTAAWPLHFTYWLKSTGWRSLCPQRSTWIPEEQATAISHSNGEGASCSQKAGDVSPHSGLRGPTVTSVGDHPHLRSSNYRRCIVEHVWASVPKPATWKLQRFSHGVVGKDGWDQAYEGAWGAWPVTGMIVVVVVVAVMPFAATYNWDIGPVVPKTYVADLSLGSVLISLGCYNKNTIDWVTFKLQRFIFHS